MSDLVKTEQESNDIELFRGQVRQWRSLTRFLPETACDRDDVAAIASLIESLTDRIDELEGALSDIKKAMNHNYDHICYRTSTISEIFNKVLPEKE